jgi:beta-galactosidase/beta-glucuronidase
MMAVPAVLSGALNLLAPASQNTKSAPNPPGRARRKRQVLAEGWHIKQFDTDKPDIPQLVREASSPDRTWLPARMPAQVHEVLLEHKLISNPHIGRNAAASAWVGEKDWAYACKFLSPSEPVFLDFERLDALAAIYVNGREVGRFDNMFREYLVDVREQLAPPGGENGLLIIFSAPLRFVERFPQPPEHVSIIAKHKYLRKSHGDFGSYLGARPHSVKVGVFRDIVLDVPGPAWIEDVWVRSELSSSGRQARLRVVLTTAGAPSTAAWTLTDPAGSETASGTAQT